MSSIQIWYGSLSLFVAHSLSRSFNCCKHSSNISLKRLSKMHSNASAWSFRGQACIDLLCKFDALVYWIQFCAHILLKNLLFIILISFAQCNVFFCSFFFESSFIFVTFVFFLCCVDRGCCRRRRRRRGCLLFFLLHDHNIAIKMQNERKTEGAAEIKKTRSNHTETALNDTQVTFNFNDRTDPIQ